MADAPSTPPDRKPSGDDSVLRMVGATAGVGMEFIATVLLPGALGYWLDRKLGTPPWLMIALGVVGFAIGLYRMLMTAKSAMKQ